MLMCTKIQNCIPQTSYYVYLLIDPRTNLPFYVGKGTGNRVIHHYQDRCKSYNLHKERKIKKLKKLGYEPKWEIIFETQSEQEALKAETENILKWGRKGIETNGILTNIKLDGAPSINGAETKKVDQYDLLGNYIQTFSSAKQAAISCRRDKIESGFTGITNCCRKRAKNKSAYGFRWSWHGTPLDIEWCLGQKKFVYQWDAQGEFVAKHPSTSAAARSCGVKHGSVLKAIRIKGTAKGFQWTLESKSPGQYTVAVKGFQPVLEPIYQWDLKGNLIKRHDGLFFATKYLNIHHVYSGHIRKAIERRGTCRRFQWTTTDQSPGVYVKKRLVDGLCQLKKRSEAVNLLVDH